MNIDVYLKRIGIQDREKPDAVFLQELQRQHLLTVPFENLDIMIGRKISLDVEKFYDKVVEERRGGFCYELNGLFYWLLDSLGYDVDMIAGRVKREHGGFGPEFDHMALIVHLDRDVLVDVGFGRGTRVPLPLDGRENSDPDGTFRIVSDPTVSSGYAFQRKTDTEWETLYTFTTIPRNLHDFAEMCRYQQTSPESNFVRKWIVSLATPAGRITLSDFSLTVTEGASREKRELNERERYRILSERFGINLP
ncbi:MAG: arylamine N-acetyltransferase [Bacillaceae bacterium]|nr:arylamine N-acetyltransferase [Bacillaceae bacterium]